MLNYNKELNEAELDVIHNKINELNERRPVADC